MTKTLRFMAACVAVSLLAMQASAQTTFDFTTDFSSGLLNGQQGWNAEGGWFVNSSGAGAAATSTNAEIATYSQPITLTQGNSFGYSMNLQFGGGPYATPTNFTYLFSSGLTDDSTASTSFATGDPVTADANIQIISSPMEPGDNYRLLSNFTAIPGITPISGSQLNAGDLLQFDYNITLGADAATTEYTIQLQNLTDGTDTGVGTVTGVDPAIYNALTGSGAYTYFQTLNPGANDSGLNGVQINSIGPLPNPPPVTPQKRFDFTGPDFSDGPLSGQQGWSAGPGWAVGDSAGDGNATTMTNAEAATYQAPIQLTNAGDTFNFSIDLEFTGGPYTTPTNFSYLFMAGLKEDNTSDSRPTGDAVAADANIQIISPTANPGDNYRLLSNFATIPGATNITDTELNAGDELVFEYTLTLGTDAATTSYDVALTNLTDLTSTGLGTVTGVDPAIFDALTGDGAYAYFQTINPGGNDTGLTGVQVNAITGDFDDFVGTAGDADGDGDVDGADFLLLQRTNAAGIPDWETNYGSSSAQAALGAVPEPTSLMLCLMTGVAVLASSRRRAC